MDVINRIISVLHDNFGNNDLPPNLATDVYATIAQELVEKLGLGETGAPPLYPMTEARKDWTPVLARFRTDLAAFTGRSHHGPWAGRWVVVMHPGIAPDGLDVGWQVAAPVGAGGFMDHYFDGWLPVPMNARPAGNVAGTRTRLVKLDGAPFEQQTFNPQRICNDRDLAETRECPVDWLYDDEGGVEGVTCMNEGCDYLVYASEAAKAAKQQEEDPETFAARYPAVAYRETETPDAERGCDDG